MKKPIGYNGFAFSTAKDYYNKKYLATKKGKKEAKKMNKRNKKHQAHLKKHGWDTTETWNLETTISCFIYPRLKSFSENLVGYPHNLTEKKWNKILKKMLFSFKHLSGNAVDDWETAEDYKETYKKIQKGLNLFSKYYQALWN